MAHATTPLEAALSALLHVGGATIAAEWTHAARGDAGAVHRIRTSSRRLRELLPIVEAALPGRGAARLRRDARRLARALGVARELDVAIETLDSPIDGRTWTGAGTASLRRSLIAARAAQTRTLRARLRAIDRGTWTARVDHLLGALAASTSRDLWAAALAARVEHRATRLDAAVAAVGTLYSAEPLHAVRIATKKLRYVLEIARDLGGAGAGGQIAALKALQDRLGRLHDLHVLGQYVRALAPPAVRRPIQMEQAALVAAIDRECREAHAVFLARRDALGSLARQAMRAGAATRGRRRPRRMTLAPRGRPRPARVGAR